jgi:hypothetical protein
VQGYLAGLEQLRQHANDKNEDFKDMGRDLWPMMRDARIYEFDPDAVATIYGDLFSRDVPRGYFNASVPFDHLYLSFGPGVKIDKVRMVEMLSKFPDESIRMTGERLEKFKRKIEDIEYYCCGYLVSGGRFISHVVGVELLRDYRTHTEYESMVTNTFLDMVTPDLKVTELHIYELWLIHELLLEIERTQHVVTQRTGMKHKLAWKKAAKKLGLPKMVKRAPPPYYVIDVEPKLIKEKLASGVSRDVEWSHRWDVEGHWRCRVRRGPLPLSPEKREQLEKETAKGHKYEIWTTGEPPSWVNRVLTERGMQPKYAGEWLAVMRYWIPAHVRGPEDKPYIPAARRLKLEIP